MSRVAVFRNCMEIKPKFQGGTYSKGFSAHEKLVLLEF